MSFTITNNSANAVITSLSSPAEAYGVFTITGGTFPLFSGDSISGTNTVIRDEEGSPYGTMLLFVQQGSAQIEVYIDGQLYSALDYSSGIAEVQIPILQVDDIMNVSVDESELPVPSPTPSITPSNTPTPTPSQTPAPTTTPTPTPSNASVSPQSLGASYYIDLTNSANVTLSGATTIISAVKDLVTNNANAFTVDPYYNYSCVYLENGYDTGKGAMSMSGYGIYSTAFTTPVSASTTFHLINLKDLNLTISNIWAPQEYNKFYYVASTDNLVFLQRLNNNTNLGTNFTGYTSLNNWATIAARTYDDGAGAVVEIWINGSLVSSATSVTTLKTLTMDSLTIGQQSALQPTNGTLLAASAYFKKKLSDSEMAQMFTYFNDNF